MFFLEVPVEPLQLAFRKALWVQFMTESAKQSRLSMDRMSAYRINFARQR